MANYILQKEDISELEKLTGAINGLIHPIPTCVANGFSRNQQLLYMHKYGVYCLPTTELIGYLRELIGEKKAIEIGSGVGTIGRSLGIPITDNRMQEIPAIKRHYEQLGQPVINYPLDVEKLDALQAIEKYKPDVVIGSYITHLHQPGMKTGNMYGVDTVKLIRLVPEYYMIGVRSVHKENPAMKYLTGYERHDFLITRNDPSESVIFRWIRK